MKLCGQAAVHLCACLLLFSCAIEETAKTFVREQTPVIREALTEGLVKAADIVVEKHLPIIEAAATRTTDHAAEAADGTIFKLKWTIGGAGLIIFAVIFGWRRTSNAYRAEKAEADIAKEALTVVATSVEDMPIQMQTDIKEKVALHGGLVPPIRRAIKNAKKEIR